MTDSKIQCPHCQQYFKPMGIKGHIWRKHTKAGKEFSKNKIGARTGGGWNKGLTKETSDSLKRGSETWQRRYNRGEIQLSGYCDKEYFGTEEHINGSSKGGGFREGAGRGRKEYLKNILNEEFLLRSSYETILANWLNDRKILWIQPKSFFYELDGKKLRYFPDFFLPNYSILIETKNDYLMSLQEEKMKAVKTASKYPLHILNNKEIENIDHVMKTILAG